MNFCLKVSGWIFPSSQKDVTLCTSCTFIQRNTFRSLPFVLCTSWQHPSFSISCEQKFPELKFKYVEEDQPEDFFIPYVWSLVFNSGVGLHWSPHGIELFSMDSGWNTCCRRRVSSPFSIENEKKKDCVCVCLCLGGCVRIALYSMCTLLWKCLNLVQNGVSSVFFFSFYAAQPLFSPHITITSLLLHCEAFMCNSSHSSTHSCTVSPVGNNLFNIWAASPGSQLHLLCKAFSRGAQDTGDG